MPSMPALPVSAPLYPGVLALILSKNPKLLRRRSASSLIQPQLILGVPGRDDYYGYGLVNAYESVIPTELPVTINLISPKGEQLWEGMNRKPDGV